MDGGRSSISAIGTVRVSAVKFRSTRLRTLSASLAGRFPATAAPPMVDSCGFWLRTTPVPCIIDRSHGPTSACNKHLPIKYTGIQKNDIYHKNDIKITYANKKNYKGGDLPISPRSSPGGMGISGSL
jgi:hypothetical protein